MKHKLQIVAILLSMFILTQFIGLYVVNHYAIPTNQLPYGLGFTPGMQTTGQGLSLIVIAFIIGIILFLFLTKIKAELFIRLWFFLFIIIALGVFFYSLTQRFDSVFYEIPIIATVAALVLAFFKVFKRNIIIHNITELLIYPGIASLFVPILNIYSILILLVLISVYDMWAVWHSKIMIKMAKYQIEKVKTFAGFFIPYMSKKVRMQLKKLKKSQLKNKKIKVNVAILGGGDVVFPIIAAGVVMLTPGFGLLYSLFVIAGAASGLLFLFIYSEKKKFYPAMPFITAGIFVGLLIAWLVSLM